MSVLVHTILSNTCRSVYADRPPSHRLLTAVRLWAGSGPAVTTDAAPVAPGFERSIHRFASFAVAFSFISIATGIFTTYGSVLASSGPLGIWTWLIVLAGQLCVAFVYASFAARIPLTGYSYQWFSRLANPVAGWIVGWLSFVFLVIVAVAVDYALASTVLPALFSLTASTGLVWAITAVLLAIQASLIALSTRATARVNSAAVLAEIGGVVGLTVLLLVVGAFTGKLDFSNLFSRGAIPAEGYFSLGTATTVSPWMLAFLLGAFTLVGFESAANLAEETDDPKVVVPRAMWSATLLAGIAGFLFLVAVTAAAGAGGGVAALAKSATPVADVVDGVLGNVVGTLLLVLVAIAIFACGLVIMITGTRLAWAMSRDDRFPGSRLIKRIDSVRGTPVWSTLVVWGLAEVILAVFSTSTDALFKLFGASTLLPAIVYFLTVVLYVVKRRSLPREEGFHLGRFEWPVIALALVWLVFELSIFRDSSFADARLYVLVMLALGLAYLGWLLVSRGGIKGLAMPDLSSPDRVLDEAAGAPALEVT